jgi:hypothetical protein
VIGEGWREACGWRLVGLCHARDTVPGPK